MINLETITLDKGSHTTAAAGTCLMEAVALFAGESHTDRPECASPILTDFGITLNDRFDDTRRQQLKPFIHRLVGTRNDGQDEARGYLALDWLIRTYTPAWLDLAGLTVEAQEMRDLRRIVDFTAAKSAGPAVRAARMKSAAVGDAAWVAAWVAAAAAAWVAAGVAAGDAARVAAGVAAWDAAGDAAGDAAWVALRPTVEQLQDSAIKLFDRMINPSAVK